MNVDEAVDEVGALTVLGLTDGLIIDRDTQLSVALADALPVPLPIEAAGLSGRLLSLVEDLTEEILPGFKRIVLAGQELILLEALADAKGCLPIVLALPSWTTADTRERIEANVPERLDVSVITIPEYPDGQVTPMDTVLLLCGFNAGGGMWLFPAAGRSVLEFYRSQLLYETVVLDPLGLPVHRRGRLFNVVTDRIIDRIVTFASPTFDAVKSSHGN